MTALPADGLALVLLVFVFGVKHGFDADHLATIDGLTRFNARANPRWARFCGTLFSLGHGAVVVAMEAVVGGEAPAAFVPIAGLHHAGRDHAAGFCVYNDCGVAIELLRRRHGLELRMDCRCGFLSSPLARYWLSGTGIRPPTSHR